MTRNSQMVRAQRVLGDADLRPVRLVLRTHELVDGQRSAARRGDALRSGREKANKGEPLGFDLRPIAEAAARRERGETAP